MTKSLFTERDFYLPYEYPSLLKFRDAIRHSYWVHTQYNYQSDIQNYRVHFDETSRMLVARSLLAISQVEIAVKRFWAKVYDWMPKPEIAEVGMTFAESEVRHANAYAHLLELLSLTKEFQTALEKSAAFADRYKTLNAINQLAKPSTKEDVILALSVFSLFIESVSLFSQFFILMSYNKRYNYLKGVSNAIEATSKEEIIHASFGAELVKLAASEEPKAWETRIKERVREIAFDTYGGELAILNWIFEFGDTEVVRYDEAEEFLMARYNQAMRMLGLEPMFPGREETVDWFDLELVSSKEVDFFYKHPVDYAKKVVSYDASSIF
jgi:ribonucleoside-diphosphate reductase beta chain